MTDPIRILIADDHHFYREGVRVMLEAMPEAEVVSEALSGDEAVALAGIVQPDVVLMDIKMPVMNGIDATRAIPHTSSHIGVLIVTMFDDDSVFAAPRAGARGYLLKDARLDDLIRCVTAVHRGEAIFSPVIARRMIQYFSTPRAPVPPQLFPELTDCEREVLTLVAQGLSDEAIAARLVLSLKTVRNHVSNIRRKLQVNDRTQAIIQARDAGLM